MKFWQLLDIFRDEKFLLVEVFSQKKWRSYLPIFSNIENVVKSQDRTILDAEIDDELLKEVCSKTKKNIYFSSRKNVIYSYKSEYADTEIQLLDAITKFSHDAIEEVFEKSEADVGGESK